ncbi:hypothetical protein EMMF5_000808 [Cystobasidiomycetes sp. EMM_F5]
MTRQDILDRIRVVREELQALEDELEELDNASNATDSLPMRIDDYRRYGRQMILPGIGLQGQLKLQAAHVLIVGAGGLGCPAMLYLAGAGHITIVDDDTVDVSNLHRQVLHTSARVGMSKAESAKIGIKSLNPRIQVKTLQIRLIRRKEATDVNGLDFSAYSLVLDCTDNATTRYYLSDACVKAGVTLVSGGAIGMEGWSGVWNLPSPTSGEPGTSESARGPCLRCVYPQSKHDNSGNCEDEGVLGTVTGIIGTLMANDALKLLLGLHDLKPCMTLFSTLSTPMFRNIKLRGRRIDCPGCGRVPVDVQEDIQPEELREAILSQQPIRILDVRPDVEFGICSIPGSINVPHQRVVRDPSILKDAVKDAQEIYFVCRRGNDSLLDARALRDLITSNTDSSAVSSSPKIRDLRGGLRAWAGLHPSTFPVY